jgi:hypothetical protein
LERIAGICLDHFEKIGDPTVTELVKFFSTLLKLYPGVMESVAHRSSADLTDLIIRTYEDLSRGCPICAPEVFSSRVKEDIPKDEWTLALNCMRTLGPVSTSGDDPFEERNLEKLTTELLWLSAMITELERREPELIVASQPKRSASKLLH